MVGDRIYTDMEMAKQAKVVSILVLSGEATLEDLNDGHEIDIIVSSVDNYSGEKMGRLADWIARRQFEPAGHRVGGVWLKLDLVDWFEVYLKRMGWSSDP